ncbi:glycosyltransferase [Neptuniibacter sp. QD72_48]|uniref:glycosyltransferase n=1 Tax=Neptuniibacter sp. QD72_48 TaxID=3398214 RepID=UPI0039F45EA9
MEKLKKYKVGFVSSSVGASGGGVSQVVSKHVEYGAKHFECCSFSPIIDEASYLPDTACSIQSKSLFSGKFSIYPSMIKDICSNDVDILHQHGIWNFVSIAVNFAKKKTGIPYVISTHGMLDPWILEKSPEIKHLLSYLFQEKNISSASLIHALTLKELEQIRSFGYTGDVAVIPNGIDLQNFEPKTLKSSEIKFLYLGRLDKKKNVLNLIKAFQEITRKYSDVCLDIYGWGDASYIEKLILDSNESDRINIHGPVFGSDKEAAFVGANFFILPSLSEGLPMAVLEAWSYGLPSLISKDCNLEIGFEANAAITLGTSVGDIINDVIVALEMGPADYEKMSASSLRLVRDEFSWDQVSDQLHAAYLWIINKDEKPSFIY